MVSMTAQLPAADWDQPGLDEGAHDVPPSPPYTSPELRVNRRRPQRL